MILSGDRIASMTNVAVRTGYSYAKGGHRSVWKREIMQCVLRKFYASQVGIEWTRLRGEVDRPLGGPGQKFTLPLLPCHQHRLY